MLQTLRPGAACHPGPERRPRQAPPATRSVVAYRMNPLHGLLVLGIFIAAMIACVCVKLLLVWLDDEYAPPSRRWWTLLCLLIIIFLAGALL